LKIATYWWGGKRHVGVLNAADETVTPLYLGPDGEQRGALALIEMMALGKEAKKLGASIPLAAVKLDAPIPMPRRNIFCVGKNYYAHAKEFANSGFDSSVNKPGEEIPAHPIIFSKVPECVISHGAAVKLPHDLSNAIDYEAELAVVIGKECKGVSAARAMDYVWGYTIVNDVTARDLQGKYKQWLIGKSLDTFCPMGPWLASADELNGQDTMVRCWVNGELRQEASTKDLIFSIPTLIETLSAGITLYPGDIIATGTPAGVGIGFKPPKYLRTGDVVKIAIDGIGTLENSFE
jgi:2-keto-4-pentenoate hydratase/2-oxohepta-3-ene-1,7-dioic acid hydratase in catechol pathway